MALQWDDLADPSCLLCWHEGGRLRAMGGIGEMGIARRRFVMISGAGIAMTAVGGTAAATADNRHHPFADAVFAAFEQHRLVAIGEFHAHQEHHDALQVLLADPRFSELVDDVVVEFGNALYQPVMDRFTAGAAVQNAELRQVWRNTTQSPLQTWDMAEYEQFFRMVRAVNWTLPAHRQVRVLLGDPPVDWSTITTAQQLASFGAQRDSHMASLVAREVLAKGRRALICYGSVHVFHSYRGRGSGGIALIEEQTGERPY